MDKLLILVTPIEYPRAKPVFDEDPDLRLQFEQAPADEEGLTSAARAKGAFGVIPGTAKYSGPLYDVLPRGGIIARYGVGHDGIDKAKCREKGIYVTNSPGALDASVAEQAVFLMGAIARNIAEYGAEVKSGKWQGRTGVELRGKTLSLLGFGRISREVARIAGLGFGMNILACDVTATDEQVKFIEGLRAAGVQARMTASLDEALAGGLFVSVHLPLIEPTRDLIGAGQLALMQPGALLINTARGGIVDENAVYDALVSGRLAGYAADVMANEPYAPVDSKKDLRTLPNCLLTPHICSFTDMSNRRMAQMCVDNISALLDGRIGDMNLVS